jgi:predicted SnoaL-like aldol condensation-catalyzing enzyme
MSDPTTHKALVAEFIDAVFTRGELEAVDRYLAPGFVNHDPFPGFAPDREGLRQTAQVFRQAFPDWHAGQEAHIAEGDLVAERFTARGTHQGEIMGRRPDRAPGRAGGHQHLPRPGRQAGGALGPHRRPGLPAATRDRASDVDVTSPGAR